MFTPKRRVTDHTPQATNPTVLFYGLVLAGLLGMFSVVFSTISIAQFKQDTTKETSISATRNTVEVLRHRKRAEQHTECIMDYMYNIIQAKTPEARRDVVRCPAESTALIDAAILRAERELAELSPDDPILKETHRKDDPNP